MNPFKIAQTKAVTEAYESQNQIDKVKFKAFTDVQKLATEYQSTLKEVELLKDYPDKETAAKEIRVLKNRLTRIGDSANAINGTFKDILSEERLNQLNAIQASTAFLKLGIDMTDEGKKVVAKLFDGKKDVGILEIIETALPFIEDPMVKQNALLARQMTMESIKFMMDGFAKIQGSTEVISPQLYRQKVLNGEINLPGFDINKYTKWDNKTDTRSVKTDEGVANAFVQEVDKFYQTDYLPGVQQLTSFKEQNTIRAFVDLVGLDQAMGIPVIRDMVVKIKQDEEERQRLWEQYEVEDAYNQDRPRYSVEPREMKGTKRFRLSDTEIDAGKVNAGALSGTATGGMKLPKFDMPSVDRHKLMSAPFYGASKLNDYNPFGVR
jgi:hypothetical protein